MIGNNFFDIMMHQRFTGHQSHVLLSTESTLSNHLHPKSSCDVQVTSIYLEVSALVNTNRVSPTYTKITNTVSTTTDFGLCTRQWGKIELSESISTVPLTRISCNTLFPNPKMRVRRGPSEFVLHEFHKHTFSKSSHFSLNTS